MRRQRHDGKDTQTGVIPWEELRPIVQPQEAV